MAKSTINTIYHGFGMNIASEISLPELPAVTEHDGKEGIDIKVATLSSQWFDLKMAPYEFIVKENQVLFYVPAVAFFAIEEGKKITVVPLKQVDEGLLRLYILGTCMGVILLQRKILPLHGSAIAIDGKAYAIVGESGAGKSTLASAFLKKGFKLVSDDIVAVAIATEGPSIVIPSYPQQKLWQESLTEFDVETNGFRPIFDRETKFSVPVASAFFEKPLPLAGIFELTKAKKERAELYPAKKLQRLHTLFSHTYRNFLIPRLGLMDWHFSCSTQLLQHANMFRLERPASGFTAFDLVSLITETTSKEEKNHDGHETDYNPINRFAK